jgi:hypothetical protein
MTDAAQAAPGQLVEIGTVAAQNIALAINVPAEHVPTIKKAIADEINAMSSHFTLALSDVQTQYEAEVYQAKAAFEKEVTKIKSVYSFVQANIGVLIGISAVVFALGVLTGFGLAA